MSQSEAIEPKEHLSRWMPSRKKAFRLVLLYVIAAALWLLLSDWLAGYFVHSRNEAEMVDIVGDVLYVIVIGIMLAWLQERYFKEIRHFANQIQDNEARLRIVGDNLPDSFVYQYTRDPDGQPRFIYVSGGVERVHGVTVAEVLRDARCLLGKIDPAQAPAYLEAEKESARSMMDFDMELRMLRPDGSLRLIHSRSRPRRDERGRILWDGFATDVTEQRKIETDQAALVARYRSLFDNMLNGFAHCQIIYENGKPVDFVYLDVNPAFRKLTGLTNVIGRMASDVIPGILAADPELIATYGRVATTGMPEQFEEYVASLKEWLFISVYSPAREHFVAIFDVITERKQAEAALHESENKLRSLFEGSRDAILTSDPESGKFTSGNAAALKMFGAATETELIACKPADLSPERQPDGRRSADKAGEVDELVLREGTHYFEWMHRRFTGELFPADVLLTRIERDGKPVILASVRDISERKQAETALRQSEEQFRTMFETASVGMGQANPHTGKLERVNRRMCEITGYSEAELLQLKVPDFTHPHDRERDWALFQSVVRGEISSYHIEKRYLRKDKKTVWVNVNMNLLRNTAGEPFRTMATIEDITERRKAEEERVRLSTALEQAAESIVITDLSSIILYVNPAFEQITGYTRREAIGQNPRFLHSGKHDAAFYKKMWDTLKRGEVWHGHFINKRKDGTLYEEDATISPVRDASGNVVNYMAIKLDVTREMELEGQFRQAQKLEAIGQLAGGVAHDFNNILTSILMQTELSTMENGLAGEVRESFEQIRRDAERAANLTRQLLLFSRRQVMQSQVLDLNETVTNLAKMLQRIIGEDVRMLLQLHPAPLMTHADAGMLDQIALNLAVNSRDAMPGGGQLLIATSEKIVDEKLARQQPDAAPGRYVCLSVTDTGCGIPPEVLPRIFEPFFTTKETGKGTGLGLATVFGIVKQHHGWLTVDSEPRCGTTFKVFLPAITPTCALVAAEARPRPRGGTETILLTEDEDIVRRSMQGILARNGYKVLEAANGEAALKIWAQHRESVALLLTDLVMPGGISGQELARLLQTENPSLKVIYASGYSPDIAGREIQLHDGENFVQKPLSAEVLLKTVRASLDAMLGG
jgi:PAS domain S-box-containing protein